MSGKHRARPGRGRAAVTLVAAAAVVGLVLAGTGVAEASTSATVGTEGGPLKVRSAPSLTAAVVGSLPDNSRLTILCQSTGANVVGRVRTTTAWDKLGDGRYVSDAYVRRTGTAPVACPVPPAPVVTAWVKPVSAPIWGGFRTLTNPNHDGDDLGALRGTPIKAVAAGTVVTAECNASPTHNCDVDGSPSILGCGWYVEVRHIDNTVTRYCHMGHRPLVTVGQTVTLGQVLGYVGDSGNSSAPHLHFEVHTGYPATRANAVDPVPFMTAHGAPLGP
jgi:murein DD-endopeptidase MepM/ murein hydrolase activator NlpD